MRRFGENLKNWLGSKAMRKGKLEKHPIPWFQYLQFGYNKELVREIKEIPGTYWDVARRQWALPVETIPVLESLGWELEAIPDPGSHKPIYGINENLHPYQKKAVTTAVKKGLWLFNDEMGLGKTPQAIETCRLLNCRKILIVCPAVVRQNWVKEIKKWWPSRAPQVGVINIGRGRTKGLSKKKLEAKNRVYSADIQIVSYNLLGDVAASGWDAIIFDEAHRLKNPESCQSKEAKSLRRSNPSAVVLGCTATLLPNQPADVWNVVDTIWPSRFGKSDWVFKFRYTNPKHNGYGWDFKGLSAIYGEELGLRLREICSRTTKHDVPDLIPPFDVKYLYASPANQKLSVNKSLKFLKDENEISIALERGGIEKVAQTLDWAEDATSAASHIAVLTHFKKTAKLTAEKLRQKFRSIPVYHIDGNVSPDDRHKILEEAKNSPRAIVVATMHSVGIGIDMTFCTETLFSELYYRPETMIQALGRFARLSGKKASTCYILVLEGTVEEIIAMKLKEKIDAINAAMRAGQTETELGKLMEQPEEDIMTSLRLAATNYSEDAYE